MTNHRPETAADPVVPPHDPRALPPHPPRDRPPPPEIPGHIGRYEIRGLLGQGAMGRIYQGFDPALQRPVAIKTIQPRLLALADTRPAALARFRNEARAAARIAHPGVAAVHAFVDWSEDGPDPHIALEYIAGRNLARVLAETPALGEGRVKDILDQLLQALEATHSQGVCHRDVKASNLLLSLEGRLKLTDFGVARILQAEDPLARLLVGTPGSMAPEQYLGEPADHRIDIFASGALLYRLLTGHAAYRGDPDTVMYRVLHESPRRPSELAGRSTGFDAIVARSMAARPEDRYPDARAMREALAAVPTDAADEQDDDTTVAMHRQPPGPASVR